MLHNFLLYYITYFKKASSSRVTRKLLLGDYAEYIGFLHALSISENHSFSLHAKLTKSILKSVNKKIRFFAITTVFQKAVANYLPVY